MYWRDKWESWFISLFLNVSLKNNRKFLYKEIINVPKIGKTSILDKVCTEFCSGLKSKKVSDLVVYLFSLICAYIKNPMAVQSQIS